MRPASPINTADPIGSHGWLGLYSGFALSPKRLPMPRTGTLAIESKTLCESHHCPNCGTVDRVTAERVFAGEHSVTRCHCRSCGHSWVPPAADVNLRAV
jgi:hypothetical protein